MHDLNALAIFAKVVEASSFSEGARRLKMPVSTVSRRIADLEEALGVRLLERSTRSLRLTDLGAEVLEQARRSVEVSDAVDNIVSNRMTDTAGVLRLSAPPSISDTLLTPLVGAFQAAYPNVRVQILVTERWVDHIADEVDLVFRRGVLKDSTLVARRLLTYRHQLVASPAYVEKHGAPETPQDLHAHRLLAFTHWRPDTRWTFTNVASGAREMVSFAPHLAMNDYAGVACSLLAGAGISDLPPVVQPDLIREGRLVEVMPAWRFGTYDLSLVYPGNRHVPRPVRLFKDFAVAMAPTIFSNLPI